MPGCLHLFTPVLLLVLYVYSKHLIGFLCVVALGLINMGHLEEHMSTTRPAQTICSTLKDTLYLFFSVGEGTSSRGCTLDRTEQGMEDQRDGRGCYEFVHLFLPIHHPMRSKIQQPTSQIIKASVRDWRRGPPHVVAGLWRGWGPGQEPSFCSWININKRNLGTLHSWFKYCLRKWLPFWLKFSVFMEMSRD